jgi:hypothetical protein
MPDLPVDLVLYGVSLTPIILGVVMLTQQLGLPDFYADWLRAILITLAAAFVLNQQALALQFPWLPTIVSQVVILVGVLLVSKGVWPDLRSGWQRLMNAETPEKMVAQGARRGRFW